MSFDWKKYLIIAQDWADLSKEHINKEALLRSSVSRAYYAAFCKSRNYLRDIEKAQGLGKSSKVHQSVIDRFEESASTAKNDIGAALRRLRSFRNNADYKDRFRDLEEVAQLSLSYAEEIIESLDKLHV